MPLQRTAPLAITARVNDHIRGSLKAPVALMAYLDFECPASRRTATTLAHLSARYGERLCVAYRHLPREGFHPHSLLAAEAAECAAAQGQFWAMHDLLFENQARLQIQHLLQYARQLQLNTARFMYEMDAEAYLKKIRCHKEWGLRLHLMTTPGILINGAIVDMSAGDQELVNAVDQNLECRRLATTVAYPLQLA